MGILVQEPGLFTTVQDEGRYGYQQFGVTSSGAMDARSLHIANLLVGNPVGAGALEMTFQGPGLLFEVDNIVAITGADMHPTVNGAAVPMYQAIRLHKGDVLKFQFAVGGSRGYVAFAGGLDVPLVMGSQSTLASKGLGGIEGRKLQKGDRIGFTAPKTELPHMADRHVPKPFYPSKEVTLRVVRGPQDGCFSAEELRRFFWHGFQITNDFDRMGCRLEREEPVRHLGDGNIISDGIACGSIQVPTNGQPIIMLADRQTVGGYTKIGTVISVDLPKIAQAKPGMRVRFIEVSLELAQELYIRELEKIMRAEKLWNE